MNVDLLKARRKLATFKSEVDILQDKIIAEYCEGSEMIYFVHNDDIDHIIDFEGSDEIIDWVKNIEIVDDKTGSYLDVSYVYFKEP